MMESSLRAGGSFRRFCLVVGGCFAIACVVHGAEVGSGLSICTDPEGDPRWNTFGSGRSEIALPWPDHATSASVVVSNLMTGASWTVVFTDMSEVLTLEVPMEAKAEAVYSLTATFAFDSNKKEIRTTTCVAARGMNGSACRYVAGEPAALAWRAAAKSLVLPTYAATDVVTREGVELLSCGFWRGMARLPLGDTVVTLNANERTLTRFGRTVLFFR